MIRIILITLLLMPGGILADEILYNQQGSITGHTIEGSSTAIYSRDFKLIGRVSGSGPSKTLYDQKGKFQGHIRDGKILDMDWNLKGRIKDGNVYDRSGKKAHSFRQK